MSEEAITGAEWLARTLAANGTTHVFFIDAVLRRTLIELGALGVTRVLAHAEKSAAYMADGYARIAGRPGICFAQSVGAANLAAGLQDAYLGHSPVIALTGREPPLYHHRNTYQELPHQPLYASVTKFSADVADAADLPRLLRQAWREAMTGSPRPAHLDLYGRSANIVETGMVSEPAGRRSRIAVGDAALSPDAVRRRDRARRGEAARGEAHRHRRRHGCRRIRRRAGIAGAGRGAGGADRHLARRARRDPDAASPVDWLPRKLCRAAHQPDRARGRPGAVRRLPHRRSGDAHLAHSAARHPGGADRHRSAGTRPQLSEHTRLDGRSEGDAGEAATRRSASPHAIPRSPIVPPASSPPGARRARRCWPATPRRSCPTGYAPRSPARCPRTASWSPTPAIPASGPRR